MVIAWRGVRKPAVTEQESLKAVGVMFCMIAMLWNAVDIVIAVPLQNLGSHAHSHVYPT